MAQRLLILKCSARKREGAELLPAMERYDGPLWQVLRSVTRTQPLLTSDLDVYGLSAKFGLIPGSALIPLYNETMDPERAGALRPAVLESFASLMCGGYTDLCLGLSQRYLRALDGWERAVPASVSVYMTGGPMGVKLGQLRAWLHGESWVPASPPTRIVAPAQARGSAQIAGKTVALSRDEVLERARQALVRDGRGASRYRNWYVLVDDRPVSAKWVVSVITDLPTTAFDAGNARRVLLALGVDVERV